MRYETRVVSHEPRTSMQQHRKHNIGKGASQSRMHAHLNWCRLSYLEGRAVASLGLQR